MLPIPVYEARVEDAAHVWVCIATARTDDEYWLILALAVPCKYPEMPKWQNGVCTLYVR